MLLVVVAVIGPITSRSHRSSRVISAEALMATASRVHRRRSGALVASTGPQRFPDPAAGCDHALADDQFGAHEDQRARAAHDLAARFDEIADLHGVDEMHVE